MDISTCAHFGGKQIVVGHVISLGLCFVLVFFSLKVGWFFGVGFFICFGVVLLFFLFQLLILGCLNSYRRTMTKSPYLMD